MRAAALVAAVSAVLVIGGCGGSSSSEPLTSPGTVETEPPATAAPATGGETTAGATDAVGPTGTTGGTETAGTGTDDEAPTESVAVEALPGLPDHTAGYDGWPRLNGEPIPPRADGDAHLGTKQVYASERAGADGVYPDGAIIVKDAVRPDADFIGLVAIMRKERGADPAHNDWVFDEYTRSSADEPFALTADDAVCWGCHMGAEQTDYVWIATLGLTE